jgi:hypothetical protein
VLVYREDHRPADTADALRALAVRQLNMRRGSVDDALGVLIAAGELESAICDAIFEARDGVDGRASTLRDISIDAARCYLDAIARRSSDPPSNRKIDMLRSMPLPRQIEMRLSEGYAYYALFPETYAASARRFRDEREPRRVCVIGIRSIGTSLAAVAAAALQPWANVASYTVRPRGHPFDRRIVIDASLRDAWNEQLHRGAWFAIVDEGPGLSGSSFASVIRALRDLDVPSDRIVLLPSWDPAPEQLRSGTARDAWARYRRYVTSALDCGITPEKLFGVEQPAIDWSSGQWRAHVGLGYACWPAVQPQHERWKTWLPTESRVLKFVGLGDYGRAAFERAQLLSSATSMTQTVTQLRYGFADIQFVDGKIAEAPFSEADAEAVGQYIGVRALECGVPSPADAGSIIAMIRTNVRELLGADLLSFASAAVRLQRVFEEAPASDIDGRMQAYEWVRTSAGLLKVDGLDHGHDHFFPGPQNPAWDLAAASLELGLSDAGVRWMVDAYRRICGDADAEARMPAYQLAYAAFRAGYASMAAEALAGTPEADRFALVLTRYREHLKRLIPSVL